VYTESADEFFHNGPRPTWRFDGTYFQPGSEQDIGSRRDRVSEESFSLSDYQAWVELDWTREPGQLETACEMLEGAWGEIDELQEALNGTDSSHVVKELGDVLWFLVAQASDRGVRVGGKSLSSVGETYTLYNSSDDDLLDDMRFAAIILGGDNILYSIAPETEDSSAEKALMCGIECVVILAVRAGLDLNTVMARNVEKLGARVEAGTVLKGSGERTGNQL